MNRSQPQILLDEAALKRTLERIAHEILERNGGGAGLALVGVVRKGDVLASRIREIIRRAEGTEVPVGRLDITLYRDDFSSTGAQRTVHRTEIPFDINDFTVVLVDDVIYTGRTSRAALDALMDYGRPRAVRLAALVDRGHRELPIQPDHTGLVVATGREERVKLFLTELGESGDKVVRMDAESGWTPGED